ncbi:MAG: hypothetical protein ACTS4T_01550 [Candidatus Hodgkinia cicadicola]
MLTLPFAELIKLRSSDGKLARSEYFPLIRSKTLMKLIYLRTFNIKSVWRNGLVKLHFVRRVKRERKIDWNEKFGTEEFGHRPMNLR